MTKQVLLEHLDALRGVVDKLPEGAEIEHAGVGQDAWNGGIFAHICLAHGIEDVASVFGDPEVRELDCETFRSLRFYAGDVMVVQYEDK